MSQNAQEIKEKILQTIRIKGPSLPVHIASAVGQSMLFTNAFLSELLSEKLIFQTYMRVGSSAIYFLRGQEPQLERFHEHIKGKEKEALMLLQQNKFLVDKNQLPPIRVALRSIRDFAIPFKKNDDIIWRYFTIPETEFKIEIKEEEKQQQEIASETLKQIIKQESEKPNIPEQKPIEELGIFDKKEINPHLENPPTPKTPMGGRAGPLDLEQKAPKEKKKPVKKQVKKSSTAQKQNDKFFNKIKEHLQSKSIEILDIESFSKEDIILRIKKSKQEQLLVAYNKKRISEEEIIKAYKKAQELQLPYMILSLGEPTKKLNEFIEAIKELSSLEKIE